MPESDRNRIDYLDIAKGLGIILVVIFHVWRGIVSAGGDLNNTAWQFADYFVYLFHMPLFFLVAGLFVERSLSKGVKQYLTDKLVFIYYPYLLWSLVSLTISFLLAGLVNNSVDLIRIVYVPILPKFHFWFLFTLMIYYLIVAWVRNRYVLLTIAVIAAILYEIPALQQPLGRYLHFFIFFIVGLLMAKRMTDFRFHHWPLALLVLVISAVVGFWTTPDTQSVWLVPAGLAGTYILLALSSAFPDSAVSGWMAALGRQSLAVYLLHILAASGSRIVLTKLFGEVSPGILLIAGIVAGVSFPLIAYAIARRFRVLKLSGLGKDARPTN